MKKIGCAILSLLLAVSLSVPAFADSGNKLLPIVTSNALPFQDTKNTWCEDAVQTCYQTGLLAGKTATRFDAKSHLTYAQIIVIAARLYTGLTGGAPVADPAEGQAWYQPSYDLLAGLVKHPEQVNDYNSGDIRLVSRRFMEEPGDADQSCMRHDLIDLLLFVLENAKITLPVLNQLTASTPDIGSGSDYFSLYESGILNGSDEYGTLDYGNFLTRGQAAAILARVVDPAQRLHFSLKTFNQCRDILGMEPDTVLVTVDGRDLTAEQCSNDFCKALREQYHRLLCDGPDANDLTAVVPDVLTAIKTDLAVEALADQEGVTVTDAELAKAFRSYLPGYEGMTAAGQHWEEFHALLGGKLLSVYEDRYGNENLGSSPMSAGDTPGYEVLHSALEKLASAMTVEQSSAMKSLDLSAAQARLAAGPYNIGL